MGFCKDFIWGAATASYQIEGAYDQDGKGVSIWDSFCRRPGKILNQDSGDAACDHYTRMEEDVKMMKELGLKAYRFSISWTRILPDGTGEVNEKGIAFYRRLVKLLKENGITPYCTLFHWDYPDTLNRKGAWMNPESPDWFAEYVRVIADYLGDELKYFFTINEPQVVVGQGYVDGVVAPGYQVSVQDGLMMIHNLLLSHGKAVKILRERIPDCKVGIAQTGDSFYPFSDRSEDIEAARIANFSSKKNWTFDIAWWNDPIFLGKYPEDGCKRFAQFLPDIKEGDMEIIHQPVDFLGKNIYHSTPVRSDGNGGYIVCKEKPGFARTAINWPVTPECLYWVPKYLYERYQIPIIITENGMSGIEWISLDGKVHDPARIDFMARYLKNLKRAAGEDVDIRGYFAWSLMDNFEWAFGYNERFGIVYVDYETQIRYPKDSAYWYRDVIRTNGECI